MIIGFIFFSALCFYLSLTEASLVTLPRERMKEWNIKLEILTENRKKLVYFFDFFQILFSAFYIYFLTMLLQTAHLPFGFFILGVLFYAVFLQFFPRHLGQWHIKKLTQYLGTSMVIAFKTLGWISAVADRFSEILANLVSRKRPAEKPLLSEGEIKMLVAFGDEEQLEVEKEEKELIESVMTFGQTLVKEVMVPRIDMICVDSNTPLTGVMDIAIAHGYSKYPVYEGTQDSIIGIVYVKDLLRLLRDGTENVKLTDIIRRSLFVPESKKVDDLLREMQKEKISMAIVVDEYGGTDGLVTIEDLVEEIVGEISDEHETKTPAVVPLNDNAWLVDGQLNLEDLNAQLGFHFPTEEFETLAGYAYGLLGRIPKAGEKAETEEAILEIAVVHRQRISKIKLSRKIKMDSEIEKEAVKEELS